MQLYAFLDTHLFTSYEGFEVYMDNVLVEHPGKDLGRIASACTEVEIISKWGYSTRLLL